MGPELSALGGPGLELETVPLGNLLLQNLVDQPVLFDHRDALELGAFHGDGEHRAAAAQNVSHLQRQRVKVVFQDIIDLLFVGTHRFDGQKQSPGGLPQR